MAEMDASAKVPPVESAERRENGRSATNLPPAKLHIVYTSGFPPFWRTNPGDSLIAAQEWQKRPPPLQWLRSLLRRR